ncbi:MAG: hypothetical protein ACEQSR_11550 [Candidatus Methylacidiphilales bacterium]
MTKTAKIQKPNYVIVIELSKDSFQFLWFKNLELLKKPSKGIWVVSIGNKTNEFSKTFDELPGKLKAALSAMQVN